jgi:hypothetical protein
VFVEILGNGTIASFIQPLFERLAGIQRIPQQLLINFIGDHPLPMIGDGSIAGRPMCRVDHCLCRLDNAAFGSCTACRHAGRD